MADPNFLNPISILSTIGGIAIDITQKVTENYPNIVTENPIEDGSPTTDHITNLPPRIQIQGGFSDLKITNLVGTAANLFTGDLSIRNRSKVQFDRLLELSINKEVFDVMDGFHLFKDMVFNSLQLLKEQEGFSVFFQAELIGIRKIKIGDAGRGSFVSGDELSRAVIANASLLTVGATTERTSALNTLGIVA